MPLPAFSNIPLHGSNATLLFSMYFNGDIAITTPDNAATIYYYTGAITGSDSNGHGVATINSAFGVTGSAPVFEVQYIMDDILVDHPLADRFTTTIRTSTFPGGIGNEIEVNQVARSETEWSGSRPQMEITIELNNSTEAIDEYYCTKMFEVPSNILDIIDRPAGGWSVAWMMVEDVKCGPSTTNDARINIQIIRVNGETGLRLRAQIDDSGVSTITGELNGSGVINGLDITYPGGVPTATTPPYDQTDEGVIVAGEKYRLEYWIKRSAGRDDLLTGRFVVVLTRLSTGVRYTVINQTGGQFWGYNSHHFKRFFPVILYTGGFPSSGYATIKLSNIEYWTKPPYILV